MDFQARVTLLRELLAEDGIDASLEECERLLFLDQCVRIEEEFLAKA